MNRNIPLSFLHSSLLLSIFLTGLLGIIASGGGGGGGGEPPATGNNPSVAAKTSTIPPGDADCPNGGILVETGIDENRNGVLDADEVDASEKVCNGADGAQGPAGSDGLNALVVIEDEPAGANCASGGKRIRSGLDANGDGALTEKEVVSDDYICNGAQGPAGNDGLDALITMNPEPVGPNCPYGGLRVDVGIDTDRNGSLEPAEITQTGFVCSGADGGIGWQVATRIENKPGNASFPMVAMNAEGNAVAVWEQYDGETYFVFNVWANRYVPGLGWGTAELIETTIDRDARSPRVAMSAGGSIIAVWRQYDDALQTQSSIWANRYVPGQGWGLEELIEDDIGKADAATVAMDAEGNAMAVWRLEYGQIWARPYMAGVEDWDTPQLLLKSEAGFVDPPQVAMGAGGNARVVWSQSDGARYNIWTRAYVAGTGWDTARLVETDDAGPAKWPQVAMNAASEAMVVWQQQDSGNRWSIRARPYKPGLFISVVETIDSGEGDARYPQVAIDADGNAVAVWEQFDGTRWNIWANRYEAGSGWGTAELIETDNAGDAQIAQVALDGSGNAMAVWRQFDGTRWNIWANRYVVGFGWGAAELIETDNTQSAEFPQVAMDGSGNAMAVWPQSTGGAVDIWANRWRAP